MFKEYDEFKQVEAKIDARIGELSQEIAQKNTEREKVAAEYKKMMVDDSSGIKLYTTAELNQTKMRVEELASEILVAEERLQLVREGKPAKLEAMLVSVKMGWKTETEKLDKEIKEIFNNAREHRAKLILEIHKAHDMYQKAVKLQRTLNQVEYIVNKDFIRNTTSIGVPNMPLIKEYKSSGISSYSLVTDKCVAPSEEELTDAYQRGKLPEWIKHYAMTGKLVTDDDLKPTQNNQVGIKERTGGGLLGKLIGKPSKQKIHTIKLQSPDPEKSLESWKNRNPKAQIVAVDHLGYNSGYRVQYTLPEEINR